jgi:hypothetical protein
VLVELSTGEFEEFEAGDVSLCQRKQCGGQHSKNVNSSENSALNSEEKESNSSDHN